MFNSIRFENTKIINQLKVTITDNNMNKEPLRWDMGQSEYVAQRGHYKEFSEKFECLFPPSTACKKVFVTDGAAWITNYLSDTYPESIQILDFFHVCEKLGLVKDALGYNQMWIEQQKERLLEGKVDIVIESIRSEKKFENKDSIISYLENNAFRMKYNEYRDKGLMISSGPIESAHRTLLQVRMKRSGQRWSTEGCDDMIKLRVAYKSGKFSIITDLLKKQAA
jgi:hypothetical protein